MTLQEFLDSRDLSLTDFAGLSGLSLSYLSRLRSGQLKPSRSAIVHIHRVTNGQVTFEDLVGDELKEPLPSGGS